MSNNRAQILPSLQSEKSGAVWLTKRIEILLSAYRRDDYADPVNFVAQLAIVLREYPRDVIEVATSPTTGIQRHCKFPPSLAEIVEFCDNLHRRSRKLAEWEAGARAQLAERAAIQDAEAAEPIDRRRAVAQRILGQLSLRRH